MANTKYLDEAMGKALALKQERLNKIIEEKRLKERLKENQQQMFKDLVEAILPFQKCVVNNTSTVDIKYSLTDYSLNVYFVNPGATYDATYANPAFSVKLTYRNDGQYNYVHNTTWTTDLEVIMGAFIDLIYPILKV